MKLLFDQNLSPLLASRLSDIFPESTHVQDVGLDRADDTEVWKYAGANGYIIVSKDSDFQECCYLSGHYDCCSAACLMASAAHWFRL